MNYVNSCLCFDAMFRYVKLMLIKLLMMKLHAQVMYICILVFSLNLDEEQYCCCWFIDDFMVNWCCCCCYEMLLLMINVMGIHNCEVLVRIKLLWKISWKMNELMICDRMMFWFQAFYGFDCLFMFINVWINFGDKFGVKGIKIEVLGLKRVDSHKGKYKNRVVVLCFPP